MREEPEVRHAAEEETSAEAPEQQPDPIVALQAQLTTEKDRALRLAAEYDNFRKRSQKEREALHQDVKTDVISALLPVYDNLERALKQETSDPAYKKGVEMIMTGLKETFTKLGICEISALGETFDPQLHDAVYHIEDENYGQGEVIEQFMQGFKLGDKIIRHSVVKVAN